MAGAPPTSTKPAPATPMTNKQITEISHDLEKMSKAKEISSPKLYADLLSQLYAGVVATEDILRQTKIGINVNRVKDKRVCDDSNVRDQAVALVDKWKKDIQSASKKSAKARGGGGAVGRGSPALGAGGSGAAGRSTPNGIKAEPSPLKTEEAWRKAKPDSRTVATDEVDYKKTGDKVRDNCVKLMYDGLAFLSVDPPSHILPIALSIEHAAYTTIGGSDTSAPYKEKLRSLYQNLKSRPNTHLRTALLATPPTLEPQHFVTMPAEAMKSSERLEEDAQMVKENKKDAMVPQEDRAISSMLTCGGCGQKKVSYSQAQTRSADEPMTTFCTCTVCGRKWKFS